MPAVSEPERPQSLRQFPSPVTHPHSQEIKRAIRQDYIEGKGSSRILAKRYDVPKDTIREWITAGNWPALRRKRDEVELAALVSAQPAPVASPSLPIATDPMLARVMEQLESVDRQLANADDDWKAFEALSRAKERLMGVWCTLTGHPRPGIRKVRSGRPQAPIAEPMLAQPMLAQTLPRQASNPVSRQASPVPYQPAPSPACDLLPGDGAGI